MGAGTTPRAAAPAVAGARALLLAALASLPACLGGSAYWHDRTHFDRPGLADRDHQSFVTTDAPVPLRSEELLAAWGEPHERELRDDGSERWTYVSNVRTMAGCLAILIILPLPLLLPTGHEKATFTVRDGVVQEADLVVQDDSTGIVGPMLGVCATFHLWSFEGSPHRVATERRFHVRPPAEESEGDTPPSACAASSTRWSSRSTPPSRR
jgi:hypothetical protein